MQTGKEIEIDPNNHTNVEGTEAKAATCTEAGNDEYWYCRGCDKYFADKECTTVITDISKVTRPATGHDYGTSTYEWNCDNLENVTCTATKKCSNCKEEATKTVNAVVEETIEATCTTPKKVTYKAEFEEEFGGTQTKTVEIGSALGHDYGTSTYEWNCDNLENVTCTATKKCSNCKEEATKTVNAVVEETIEATCTTPKKVTYKAEFEEEFGGTQTKTVEIGSAKGHTYGKVEYTWSNDYGNCTAKRVCQNDTSHVETENATKITENIIKAATCEGVGKKTYKAEFNSFTSCETEELDIPATGHKCNDTWEHNETQHWKVCETCEKEVNAANHTDENSDGTCDVCGYVTTPDTYTVSGTVYTWDNTDSNTTRVRLYDSTTSEADIKSDIQHDITDESYAKTCQYDATVLGPEKVEKTNKYTQSFSFADVKSGNYKLAAWRPAYNISSKHYAYVLRVDSIDISETLANNKIELMLYGDITNIGIIGAAGAITIARYRADDSRSLLFSDKTSEYQKKAMDLNDDGTYSPYESICIARHRANIDSPFNQHI